MDESVELEELEGNELDEESLGSEFSQQTPARIRLGSLAALPVAKTGSRIERKEPFTADPIEAAVCCTLDGQRSGTGRLAAW